jgi:phosphoribosyl-ATP pyrophosphohydrolase/phosphoribosyl-AMP cyclohydrolase
LIKLTKEEIAEFVSKVNFEKGGGLVPAIVQDASTGAVLMQAFMNPKALEFTLASGKMHYWSRTKGRIWMKGEESENYSLVQNAFLDCDNDAILFTVQQIGAVCHTGEKTCFHKPLKPEKQQTVDARMLERLFEIIHERIRVPSQESYVARLTAKGEDAVLQKVGEEAVEFILAVKSGNTKEITWEAADVFFHMLVALAQKGYNLNNIFEELESRNQKRTSGQ